MHPETERETVAARELQASDPDFRAFVNGYVECLLWAETAHGFSDDPDDDTSWSRYDFGADDFTESAINTILRDCADFYRANKSDLEAYAESTSRHPDFDSVYAQAGADFHLSRNGHGAGFFDRCDELGDRLQSAARPYGETHFYATSTDPETAEIDC